jgi:YVTN family beta-propeller protein
VSNKEKLSNIFNSEHGDDEQSIEPFIGPHPFRRGKEDQLRFFGRDAEIDEIVTLIASHRIVLIYAQSGAGKTSIFNAGVIPSLESEGFEVLPMARVQVTSTTSPTSPTENNNNNISSQIENVYIYNALLSLHPDIDPKSTLDLALFEFLDKYFPIRKDENSGEIRPQVLIFDQLEELFSFYPDNWLEQQKGFFRQVADSLDNNPFLRIVFIIREDFLARLDPFRGILPEKLSTRFRLERLRRKEATQAIKGPLKKIIENVSEEERANIYSEINALVNGLSEMYVESPGGSVRRLEGEFIEPIQLQVVCRRWWHERQEASKRLGNKKTSLEDLGNLDRALEDFYEDAIITASKQTGVHETKIRTWCQQNLITKSGTRSMVHRGQETTEGIDNEVLDWLERKYLIRREWRSGASWYELTHDRLVKPMTSSNAKWKNAIDRKKNKQRILTTGVGAAAATAIIVIIVVLPFLSAINSTQNSIPEPQVDKHNVTVGHFPISVAFNPTTQYIYVANAYSRSISAFSGNASAIYEEKNTQIAQQPIHVPGGPKDAAVNPTNNMIYVTNYGSDRVSIIDGTTNTILGTMSIGDGPTSVAVNPTNNMIYVTNGNDGTVSVIDGTTRRLMTTTPVGDGPYDVDVNPNTNMIYVTNYGSNTTSVIDGRTNTILGTMSIGDGPTSVAVNPTNNMIYVADNDSDTVSVINGTTNTLAAEDIAVDVDPVVVDVNPNTNMIYVANYGSNTVSVINGTTNTLAAEDIPISGLPANSIAVNPNTNMIYVPSFGSNTVSVINGTTIAGTTNTVVAKPITVGDGPYDVAVNPNTNMTYVLNYGSNTVSVINGTTNTLAAEDIAVDSASGLAVNPNTNMTYVANYGSDRVSIIDGTTNTILGTMSIGDGPESVAVNPNTNMIYVANADSDTVSVIDGTANMNIKDYLDARINDHTSTGYQVISSGIGNFTLAGMPAYTLGATSIYDFGTQNVLEVGTIFGDKAYYLRYIVDSRIYQKYLPIIEEMINSIQLSSDMNVTGTSTESFSNDHDSVTGEMGAGDFFTIQENNIGREQLEEEKWFLYENAAYGVRMLYPSNWTQGDGHREETTGYTLLSDFFSPSEAEGYYANVRIWIQDLPPGNLAAEDIAVGDGPYDVDVNPNTNMIYVTNYNNNTVSVINGRTNTLAAEDIAVDNKPTGIDVNPNTNMIYVTNSDSNTVSVIDGRTNNIVRTISTDTLPVDVAVNSNPDTNAIYLTNLFSHIISVIDGTTHRLMGTIPIGGGSFGIAVNPSNNMIYVAHADSDRISVIDGRTIANDTTNTFAAEEIPISGLPTSVAVDPSNNMIYVADNDSDTVSVIDGRTNTLAAEDIAVGDGPTSVAVDPTNNMIYVTNSDSNTTSAINGTTNTIVGTISVGDGPTSVAVDPTNNMIYVTNSDSDTVSVIDGRTNTLAAEDIAVGDGPTSVAVDPSNNMIYVTNYYSDTVSVIDGRTNTIVGTISVGDGPTSVAVDPNTNNTIYVTNAHHNTVSIMRLELQNNQ